MHLKYRIHECYNREATMISLKIRLGRRRFKWIPLIEFLAKEFNISKREVKRVMRESDICEVEVTGDDDEFEAEESN